MHSFTEFQLDLHLTKVYSNDLIAVRQLLKEVDKERYESALKNQRIAQKPLGMNGFFVEYEVDTKDINLYYQYPC